jgi:hypothetical protein
VVPSIDAPGANTCIRIRGDSAPCSWTIAARAGAQVHYATILDGDDRHTPDDRADDVYALLGYAVGTRMDLSAGETRSDDDLIPIPADELVPLSIQLDPLPDGMTAAVAAPVFVVDDGLRLPLWWPRLSPDTDSTRVPGAWPGLGGHYEVGALATASDGSYSIAVARELALPAASPGPWPAPPHSGGGDACAADCWWLAESAGPSVLTFRRDGMPVWELTDFTINALERLPAQVDPLGIGRIELTVEEYRPSAGWSTSELALDDVVSPAGKTKTAGLIFER